MKRRTALLVLSGVTFAVAAPVGYHYVRYVVPRDPTLLARAILTKHLPGVEIDDESLQKFVMVFGRKLDDDRQTKAAWLGIAGSAYEVVRFVTENHADQLRRLEDAIVTEFVLGSNLLDEGTKAKKAFYRGRNDLCIGKRVERLS